MHHRHHQVEHALMETLHGEAWAFTKYLFYAKVAEKQGHHHIACLFRLIAAEEFEHFEQTADLLSWGCDTKYNLMEAFRGEINDANELYPGCAKLSHRAGEEIVAAHFLELAEDEARHACLYNEAIAKLLHDH